MIRRRIGIVRFSMFALCMLFLGSLSAQSQQSKDYSDQIKEASVRRICYDSYWRGEDIMLGNRVIFEMVVDSDRFFVWINDLVFRNSSRFVVFQEGIMKNGKAFVTREEEYNLKISPPPFNYATNRKHFTTDRATKHTLILPKSCTPRYDPPSAKKETMLNTIVRTMTFGLNFSAKEGLAGHPVEFNLIIANFNIDYPYSYVLVEPTKELYLITLHDLEDWESEEYEREGGYPYQRIYEEMPRDLLEKIRKHGILRKIVGTPVSGERKKVN